MVTLTEWQPMGIAPKDRPILAWCEHAADPYFEDSGTGRLTTYGAHAEGLDHAPDGYNVIVWGGGFQEDEFFGGPPSYVPDWWFVAGSDFECVASPVCWANLPEPPPKKNPAQP